MIRILLIEDDEDDVFLFNELLVDSDLEEYEVEWVPSYDQALGLIKKRVHDIFLVDYNLGKQTGLELMKEARVAESTVPFILLTGVAIKRRDQEALALGAYDFLVKGNMTADLVARSIRYAVRHASVLADLKKSEKEKHTLLEQQFTTQKVQAIGTLVGGVAHDFNNILGGMIAAAERLNSRLEYESQLKIYTSNIMTLANRGKNVVKQLLTYSRNQETETAVSDINPVVEEALSMVRAVYPAMIMLSSKISDEPNYVHCESTQVHQLTTNLLMNACQSISEETGEVEVQVAPVSIEGGYARDSGWTEQQSLYQSIDNKISQGKITPQLRIGLLEQGEYVQISVVDNGRGMDIETMSRIMDPFFTTKASEGGTGLGLATVKGIVSMLKGGMLVTSSVGAFTKFDIFLPMVTEHIESLELARTLDREEVIEAQKILIVDDEPILGTMYKEILISKGYDVTFIEEPDEALKQIEQMPEKWKLILIDQNMRNMTGLVLVEKIREWNSDVAVMIWSGKPIENVEELQATLKISHILLKPVEINELMRCIADAFASHKENPTAGEL